MFTAPAYSSHHSNNYSISVEVEDSAGVRSKPAVVSYKVKDKSNLLIVTHMEITTNGALASGYPIFANGLHEAPIYMKLTFESGSKRLTPQEITDHVTLYNYDTDTKLYWKSSSSDNGYMGAFYWNVDNGFNLAMPEFKGASDQTNNNGDSEIGIDYFMTKQVGSYAVCGRITQFDGKVISTCKDGTNKPLYINAIPSKHYQSDQFFTRANYTTYYSWTAGLCWMYNINEFRLIDSLQKSGYLLHAMTDVTGRNAMDWNLGGSNYNIAEGMGGVNNGLTNSTNYGEGALSDKTQVRYHDSSSWLTLYNAHIYDKGEKFYSKGVNGVFYIATWHGPGGSGNWGAAQSHKLSGSDNFGNPINVWLNVCAGSYGYDGKCNQN